MDFKALGRKLITELLPGLQNIMHQVIRKKATGDLIALLGINIIPLFLLLEQIGIVSLFGEKRYWYLITAACCLFSIPIWARLLSTAPLVEMDENTVTFYVGLLRKRSIRISRGSLISVLDDTQSSHGERIKVLRLVFAHGSLQTLSNSPITPYLTVSKDEVAIQSAFIDGDLSQIAEAFSHPDDPKGLKKGDDPKGARVES